MSKEPDPQDGFESTDFEPTISGDKRIIFGARKPTEEAAPLMGITVLIEAPFPHERTLHWWPTELPFELHANGNTAVVVSQEVLVKVNEHVAQSLDHELGGFLLGNRYRCPNSSCDYVIIDQYSPARYTESSEVRLNFTHDAWAQLSDELSGKFLGKLLIGWYHSHPRMDVFLSSHDMEIQTERFPEPWMVALVLEPEKHRGGFFRSRNGYVKPNSPVDFFELLERNSRDSVIAWDNYKPMDPATSSTPPVNQTSSAEATQTTLPELPLIETEVIEESPVRRRRRGRLFVTAVLVVLAGVIAVGIIKRNRIKGWLQNRGIIAATTYQPTPTPSLEQTPTPQNVAATPDTSPASSPTPSSPASPTPAETLQATSNTNQPKFASSPATQTGRRDAPKRSRN